MKKTLRTILVALLILQSSACFGQLVLPSPFDSSFLKYSKYFEMKIELKGKCALDKEIILKYQLKNISDKNRKLWIYQHFGSPIGMEIIVTTKSGIPLKYQSKHLFSNVLIKPSLDNCKDLKPNEIFTGEVSLHSALSGEHGLESFFLTSGEYILKVKFFDITSNDVTFQLANIPEFDTIQNMVNKYVPSDWEVYLCGIQSYPKKNILDENGKFVATVYIKKKKGKEKSDDIYDHISLECYKSKNPEFGNLVINNRMEPKDCMKNIPDDYNYRIATINDKYIFVTYGSQCWDGFCVEQKEIIKNIIDGINKNHYAIIEKLHVVGTTSNKNNLWN